MEVPTVPACTLGLKLPDGTEITGEEDFRRCHIQHERYLTPECGDQEPKMNIAGLLYLIHSCQKNCEM